ncbi:MAG: hypothetical protein ACP5MU_00225 [Thermoplasmata archaeon]
MTDFDFNSFEKRQMELKEMYRDVRISREFWKRKRNRRRISAEIAQMAEVEVGNE